MKDHKYPDNGPASTMKTRLAESESRLSWYTFFLIWAISFMMIGLVIYYNVLDLSRYPSISWLPTRTEWGYSFLLYFTIAGLPWVFCSNLDDMPSADGPIEWILLHLAFVIIVGAITPFIVVFTIYKFIKLHKEKEALKKALLYDRLVS